MPRPIEPLATGEDFKTVSFKLSAKDRARVEAELDRQERESGYPVELQALFRDLVNTLPEVE